ncbi:MAG: indole-3-glycerol phosphate synthase TrpC [Deltaproteobacteria bacterium]|nr:indole-3-glycerol phosphate synthase TrpC [Deltaproteobacteria bacterium]
MILDEIAAHVREEIETRRRKIPPSALRERPLFHLPSRRFEESLSAKGRRIIAEIKRASPSKGVIRDEFNAVEIAKLYAANGASALSVLTENRFFQGHLEYLEKIKREVPLPLLRKDFILDRYQLLESRSFGADAVLLIAALLDPVFLKDLLEEAKSVLLDALIEIHTETELESALQAGARMVGINNRDLRTFEIDLGTTERLLPKVPSGIVVVCESGIETVEQIQRFEALGVHRFLIGETLMRARDPGAKLRELLMNGQS